MVYSTEPRSGDSFLDAAVSRTSGGVWASAEDMEKRLARSTLGIVGLGLMGGAFALAFNKLRRTGSGPKRLLAHDRDGGVLRSACEKKIIDEAFDDPVSMLGRCDLVLLCLNPSTLKRFVNEHEGAFKENALVTDSAGIKKSIAVLARRLAPRLDFIPGHPMAGAEKGGFANAEKVDFTGKNYILTPLETNKAENRAFLAYLFRRIGFGRITETTAEDHDDKIAFTSQLCHVIAASLVDCEADTEITRYGGGSFEDLTRIAMLNAPLWTELFLENSPALLHRIGAFQKSLKEIKGLIEEGRGEELEARLAAVRDRAVREADSLEFCFAKLQQ